MPTAATALKAINTEKSLKSLNNELAAVQGMPNLKESDWEAILSVYKDVLRDTAKTKEIEQQILAQFPQGKRQQNLQRAEDYKAYIGAKDNDARLAIAKQFLDKHPYDPANRAFDEANRINYTSLYWIISVFTSVNNDLETYTKYVSTAPAEAFGQIVYRSIDVPYRSQQTTTAEAILPYAKVAMARIKELLGEGNESGISRVYYGNAPLFARILAENKLYDEAFEYAAAAQSSLNFANADLNHTYVRILQGQGKNQEASVALETAYRLNQSSTYYCAISSAGFPY